MAEEIDRYYYERTAAEHGFDHTFEAYVAGPLAEFALRASPRERIWIADTGADAGGRTQPGSAGVGRTTPVEATREA